MGNGHAFPLPGRFLPGLKCWCFSLSILSLSWLSVVISFMSQTSLPTFTQMIERLHYTTDAHLPCSTGSPRRAGAVSVFVLVPCTEMTLNTSMLNVGLMAPTCRAQPG